MTVRLPARRSGSAPSLSRKSGFGTGLRQGRGLVAVVPGDLVPEKHVFLERAPSDVVDHERHAARGALIRNDPDMRNTCAQQPGDEIARFVRGWVLARGELRSMPREKGRQIRHPAVI